MSLSPEEQRQDLSRSPHRPLHWYVDDACSWITAATYQKGSHFDDAALDLLAAELPQVAAAFEIELSGWTILRNHYHLLGYVSHGRSVPAFIQRFHGRTSRLLNARDGARGRQVWRQYWETLVRTDGDFWARLNYTWWNPVRHGYVATPEGVRFQHKAGVPTTALARRLEAALVHTLRLCPETLWFVTLCVASPSWPRIACGYERPHHPA